MCVCHTQAIEQLLEVEERRKEGACTPSTLCVGIARLQVRLLSRTHADTHTHTHTHTHEHMQNIGAHTDCIQKGHTCELQTELHRVTRDGNPYTDGAPVTFSLLLWLHMLWAHNSVCSTFCCVCALQADDQLIVAGTLDEVKRVDFGAPLHSLIVAGSLHEIETQMLAFYMVDRLRQQGLVRDYVPDSEQEADPDEAPVFL